MSSITIKAINEPVPSMRITRPCGACPHFKHCQHFIYQLPCLLSCQLVQDRLVLSHNNLFTSSLYYISCSHTSVGQLCNEPLIPGQVLKKFLNFILRYFLLSNKNLNHKKSPAIHFYSVLSHSSLPIFTSSFFSFPSSSATVFSSNSTKEEEWPKDYRGFKIPLLVFFHP